MKQADADTDNKYKNYLHFCIAKIWRILLRFRLSHLVDWSPVERLENGCTIIIGICSKLPSVLTANLICLSKSNWEDVKEILVAVDGERGVLPRGFEEETIANFSNFNLKFLYYSPMQARIANQIGLPFIYSWLSWCICLSQVQTKTVLIHDYDALVIGNSLKQRYLAFTKSSLKIQGIEWYEGNGIVKEDGLAKTFEAFVDVAWVRHFPPILLFNQVAAHKGRWVDYDTLLDLQANYTNDSERDIIPMDLDELVHPSQMIHQYTMFKKYPGQALPCFSIIMIPFFNFLGGDSQAIERASQAIREGNIFAINLLGDDTIINLSRLTIAHVDWMLKLMLQVLVYLNIKPFKQFIEYGTELYQVCQTQSDQIWVGDFLPQQRQWIEAANQLTNLSC